MTVYVEREAKGGGLIESALLGLEEPMLNTIDAEGIYPFHL